MTVIPLGDRREHRDLAREQAKQRHPATAPVRVQPKDAVTLRSLALAWDDVVDVLSQHSSHDEAVEVVTGIFTLHVHPFASSSLVFHLPELLELARTYRRLVDGTEDPHDLDMPDTPAAIEHVDEQIDLKLWVLLTGLPITDACRQCVRRGTVTTWQTRMGCSVHAQRAQ